MKALVVLLLAAAVMPGASAQAEAVATERGRIAEERRRAEAGFVAEEKACYRRFAVNDCLQDARSRRRDALAELRRQEVALNDAERRRRAAERLQDLEERAIGRDRNDAPAASKNAAPTSPVDNSPAAVRSEASSPAAAVPSGGPPAPPASPQVPNPAVGAPAAGTVMPAPRPAGAELRRERPPNPGRPSAAERPRAAIPPEPPLSLEQRQRQQRRVEEAQARKEKARQKAAARTTERARPLPVP